MADPFNPVLPQGDSYHTYTAEQIIELNRQAAAKKIEADKTRAMLLATLYKQSEDGQPLPNPDAAEEQRLRTGDFRGSLRQAQRERAAIAARLGERRGAAARAQVHLEAVSVALAGLEQGQKAAEREAARALVERFRSGPQDVALSVEVEVPASLDLARHAVIVAEQALNTLVIEVTAAEHELKAAQRRVDLAELDLLMAEVLRLGEETLAHYRAGTQGRSELIAAGYLAADRLRRLGLPSREFTSTVRAAIDYREPDRAPPASVDWRDFITRLDADAEASLKQGD
jgi:hypothetical protein